jgi:formylglycine-generating enzyme required for sulfatase activity
MRRVWVLVLLTSVGWLGPATLGQAPGGAKGEKYALLVGVRQYETPDLRALKYPESDVEELAKVLINSGYRPENVKLMTQRRGAEEPRYLPIASKIRKELGLILNHLDENDSVIVALAGHGVQFQADEEAYFCPADALLGDRSTLIPLGSVYDAMKGSGAGFKLLLVDACRNNPLTELGRDAGRPVVDNPSMGRPIRKRPPGGVAALFSCSTGEKAFEHPDLQHGVFFHFVIKALEGEADGDADGKVDLNELTSFATRRVYRFVENKLGVAQNPEFLGKANAVTIVDLKRAAVGVKELVNTLGMKLVLIPATGPEGFQMGSDDTDQDAQDDEKVNGKKHRVRITKSFYMGTTEVTVGQFRKFVEAADYRTEAERDGKGGYGWDEAAGQFKQDPKYTWRSPGFTQADDHPVVNVSWNDAVAFCDWLRQKEGQMYRLPTEAEWEYACRAGGTAKYWLGDDPEWLAVIGNVADGTAKEKYPDWPTIKAKDGYVFTAPVGRFRANPFGLFDVHGNVLEWCSDGYESEYYKQSPVDDPKGPSQAASRVIRGGCWGNDPRYCRSAFRDGYAPDNRGGDVGFRVARVR